MSPSAMVSKGFFYYRDGSCSFKIVFKKRGATVCRSSEVDATRFSSAHWAVQIPSPVQADVQRGTGVSVPSNLPAQLVVLSNERRAEQHWNWVLGKVTDY